MRYPGGKGKCYQRIINLMPVHSTYIESHLGGGAVMRHKKLAAVNIGIDRDAKVIERWEAELPGVCNLVHADATSFLTGYAFRGDELVYADPPYVQSTRRSQGRLYRHDLDEAGHRRLLDVLKSLPCMVMISGYDNPLYRDSLASWRRVSFVAKTHVDMREESVWLNFAPPLQLHDGAHLGSTYRERQTVKRRNERWLERLDRMAPAERSQLLSLIRDRYTREVSVP
jgi:site-specific DNA-adenine methylase